MDLFFFALISSHACLCSIVGEEPSSNAGVIAGVLVSMALLAGVAGFAVYKRKRGWVLPMPSWSHALADIHVSCLLRSSLPPFSVLYVELCVAILKLGIDVECTLTIAKEAINTI